MFEFLLFKKSILLWTGFGIRVFRRKLTIKHPSSQNKVSCTAEDTIHAAATETDTVSQQHHYSTPHPLQAWQKWKHSPSSTTWYCCYWLLNPNILNSFLLYPKHAYINLEPGWTKSYFCILWFSKKYISWLCIYEFQFSFHPFPLIIHKIIW